MEPEVKKISDSKGNLMLFFEGVKGRESSSVKTVQTVEKKRIFCERPGQILN